jgi:hypothetical protein
MRFRTKQRNSQSLARALAHRVKPKKKSFRQTHHPGLQLGNHPFSKCDRGGELAFHPASQRRRSANGQKREEAQSG